MTANPGQYVGVASCGGTTCHGRSLSDGPVVRQDEMMLWQDDSSAAGAHSRAFRVLQDPRSRIIAQRLGIGEATTAPMCLGCHATPAPTGQTGARFLLSDGVGCEGCHGPASGWLSSHYSTEGTHRNNLTRGMIDLDNPRTRAERCLNCHFGNPETPNQFVTHRIMAAGHPRISFELDLFSTLQQHWDDDDDYRERKGRTSNVQMWAIGQAVALERSLTLFVSRRGQEGIFPEFYFLDCHSCHRPISDNPQFNPTVVANPARPIPSGYPPYNDENMIMLSAAARIVAPTEAARFEQASRDFHASMGRDRAAMVSAANNLRTAASRLASAFEGEISRDEVFRIIDTITGNAISERFTDYAGSVQAVMATDTLLSALVNGYGVDAARVQGIRGDINIAYQAVREPNAYNPGNFRASLGRAAAAIRRLR